MSNIACQKYVSQGATQNCSHSMSTVNEIESKFNRIMESEEDENHSAVLYHQDIIENSNLMTFTPITTSSRSKHLTFYDCPSSGPLPIQSIMVPLNMANHSSAATRGLCTVVPLDSKARQPQEECRHKKFANGPATCGRLIQVHIAHQSPQSLQRLGEYA